MSLAHSLIVLATVEYRNVYFFPRKAFSVVNVTFNCLGLCLLLARLVRRHRFADVLSQIIPMFADTLGGNWDQKKMIVQPMKFLFQPLDVLPILSNLLRFLFRQFAAIPDTQELTSAAFRISSKVPTVAFKGGPAIGTASRIGAAMVSTALTSS